MTKEFPITKFEDGVLGAELVFWGVSASEMESELANPMILRDSSPPVGKRFDLEERTSLFGESVILFCKKVPTSPSNNPLINQLARAGTSIGANYCEADDAVSKKEFKNKIGTCRKEARESKYWLRMIATAEPCLKDEARELWKEARELHLIFCKIFQKS